MSRSPQAIYSSSPRAPACAGLASLPACPLIALFMMSHLCVEHRVPCSKHFSMPSPCMVLPDLQEVAPLCLSNVAGPILLLLWPGPSFQAREQVSALLLTHRSLSISCWTTASCFHCCPVGNPLLLMDDGGPCPQAALRTSSFSS